MITVDYKTMESQKLLDLLAEYTADFTKTMVQGVQNIRVDKLRTDIISIQLELAKRKAMAKNKPADAP